ncbi:hypothetical protein FW774_07635 [Pedobacter sp. BS3]|uniref:hypothetical protein n=1 Tax=Pedobacter sp. BS3 TaxID=2567937 RepID=UPI0011EE9CF6|nr:hypothetical protein [Pedobacter sp. BS3]TZF84839.1 hypothetical protein FW774_07635 [Pedobacter sp. BS3]
MPRQRVVQIKAVRVNQLMWVHRRNVMRAIADGGTIFADALLQVLFKNILWRNKQRKFEVNRVSKKSTKPSNYSHADPEFSGEAPVATMN